MNYKIFKTDLKPWLKKFFFEKFSYIIKAITGTIITITDGIRKKVNELKMSKLSTQETTTGKNLFNKNQIVIKKYLNSSGEEITDSSFCISDYIAVIPGESYTYQGLTNVGISPRSCYYDENKNFVSSFKQAIGNNTITISNNIYYVRFTIRNDYQADDVPRFMIEKGSTATDYEPYTGGIPAPNSDYPQDVNVITNNVNVKIIGKNSFDKNNVNFYANNSTDFNSTLDTNNTRIRTTSFNIDNYDIKANVDYVVSGMPSGWELLGVGTFTSPTTTNTSSATTVGNSFKITDNSIKYIFLLFKNNNSTSVASQEFRDGNIQIEKGTVATSYETFKETNISIPLNGNEIAGIGNYKDELIVDKNGHCYLNKKIGKIVLDGTENWERNANGEGYYRLVLSINNTISVANDDNIIRILSDYFVGESAANVIVTNPTKNIIGVISNNRIMVNTIDTNLFGINLFKTWLSTHNTDVYYVLETPHLIDLNYNVDLRLFKGVNNISNSDDMDMTIKYYSK